MAGKRKFNPNFFQYPNLYFSSLSILVFMVGIPFLVYFPDLFQDCFSRFPAALRLLKYRDVFKIVSDIVIVVHCLESVLAIALCLSKGLTLKTTFKWTIAVFLNGVLSLNILYNYNASIGKHEVDGNVLEHWVKSPHSFMELNDVIPTLGPRMYFLNALRCLAEEQSEDRGFMIKRFQPILKSMSLVHSSLRIVFLFLGIIKSGYRLKELIRK